MLSYVAGSAADLLMPRECLVCGRKLLRGEERLCTACFYDLPLTYFWLQSRNPMADRFNALIQNEMENTETSKPDGADVPYAEAVALYHYRAGSGYDSISKRLKYHGDLRAGKMFGKMLALELNDSPHFGIPDVIVPVPLHWTREWSRGYNQAEIIASSMALELGVPARPRLLVRSRRTRTQTRLSVTEKAANVKGAFSVRGAEAGKLAGRESLHILIVDDVFTTGATMHECHKALRSWFGAAGMGVDRLRISAAALGFAG